MTGHGRAASGAYVLSEDDIAYCRTRAAAAPPFTDSQREELRALLAIAAPQRAPADLRAARPAGTTEAA